MIYVVDDEVLIAEVVQAVLEPEGFEVRVFSDPAAALRAFTDAPKKPDLLMTDYVMSPISGMELVQKCRHLHPGLLTILYSGNVSEQITDLYSEKPNAFLAKPFYPKDVVQLVRGVLEGRGV